MSEVGSKNIFESIFNFKITFKKIIGFFFVRLVLEASTALAANSSSLSLSI